MAKHCDVCKRPYPDHLQACPHCAAAKGRTDEDSAVNLGAPLREPGEPISGGSSVDYSTLPPGTGRSDVHLVDEPPPGDPVSGVTLADEDLPGPLDLVTPPGTEQASAAAQAARPDKPAEPKRKGAPATMLATSDQGTSRTGEEPGHETGGPPARKPGGKSTGEMGLDTQETIAEAFPDLDKPAPAAPPARAKGSGVEVSLHDVVGDLADEPEVPPPGKPAKGSGVEVSLHDVVGDLADEDSNVDLGAAPEGGERPSGLDLIAESVESGVDLRHESTQDYAQAAEDEAAAALLDNVHDAKTVPGGEGEELVGGVHDVPTAREGDSAVDLGSVHEADVDSDVLGSQPPPKQPFSELELDLQTLGTQSPPVTADAVADLEETDVELGRPSGTAEATEVTEEAEEGEEKPGRKLPPWLGSGAAGAAAGAAAMWLGLWLLGPSNPPARPPSGGTAAVVPTAPPAPTPVAGDPLKDLAHGDFSDAVTALASAPEDDPKQLEARGEAKWLAYLQKQKKDKQPLKTDDADVQQAEADLKKANNAQAVFWLGQIHEQTGDLKSARATYQDGLNRFKENPAEQRLFQAALDRLDARAGGPAARPAQSRGELPNRQAGLVLLVTLLQAESPAAGDAEPEEAGYSFWKAAKLAQGPKPDYAAAVQALQAARAAHEQRRFLRLRKAQNPESDPNEEIFLKACDMILASWQTRESAGSLAQSEAERKKLADALNAVRTSLTAQKVLPAGGDPVKGVQALVQARQASDEKSAKLEEDLKKATEESTATAKKLEDEASKAREEAKAAADRLSAISAEVGKAGIKQADAVKAVGQLVTAKREDEDILKAIADKLEKAKLLPPNQGHKALVESVDRVVTVAQTDDAKKRLSEVEAQLANLEQRAKQQRTPLQMLGIWMPLLASREAREIAERAAADAALVTKDPAATASAKAEALAIEGLALRNQAKFTEARETLEKAVQQGAAGTEGTWQTHAKQALKELSDPAAYYLPQTEQLRASGRVKQALGVVDEGLAVFPKEGRLLALRGLLKLDQAHAKGKVSADDPAVKQAQEDARAAVAAGATAEGSYAAGRVAEEMGNLTEARQDYRKALEAHPGTDEQANRYRLALARVLLKSTQPRPTAPRGERAGQQSAALSGLEDALRELQRARALAVLTLLLGLQDQPAASASSPDVEEALKLADQLIAAKNYEGYLIKARALAQKGLWTDALNEYVEGLKKLIPADYAEGLYEIVEKHPAFKRPAGLQPPDPVVAEQHYAAGLLHYYDRRFPQAEKEFYEAVRFNDQDARYLYFLGLSRLAEGKRDFALEDFRVAARLEQENRPSRAAVSAALERVQGPARQTVNRYRQ